MKKSAIWCLAMAIVAGGHGWEATAASPAQQSPPAASKEISLDLAPSIKLELVLIPEGEFMMGSPDSDSNAAKYEKPQHRVRITNPFYLGKYPVTQEQWETVMGSNPSWFQGAKNPVERVTWNDCQAFLEKLNAKFAKGMGRFALPTEAQWEYACRAGSTTRYCFGDDDRKLGDYAWYFGNSGGKTQPVGGKKPNAWGLYDVHGNIWEWCADWYDPSYYAASPKDHPTGAAMGLHRVIRGGCWIDMAGTCRSAGRGDCEPGLQASDLGFRVCLIPADK